MFDDPNYLQYAFEAFVPPAILGGSFIFGGAGLLLLHNLYIGYCERIPKDGVTILDNEQDSGELEHMVEDNPLYIGRD